MRAFIDKLALFTGCFLFSIYDYPDPEMQQILAVLSAITFLCLCTYCNPDIIPFYTLKAPVLYVEAALLFAFFLAALIQPVFTPFLPLLFYELVQDKIWQFLPVLPVVFLLSRSLNTAFLLPFLLLFVLAFLLKSKTILILQLEQDFKRLRDTSTEYNLLLQQKNQELMKQQDYEIHVATLKERNRIAREIHDNVGHMLSRSILQSGALIAINKDPNLQEPLNSLKDTLSLAMNSIRESVHDLHDESVDLKASLSALLKDFAEYDIHMEYDMGAVLPKNIKYCFIAIVKEALSNISKHSNATRIKMLVREHPSFYQLIIEDNGTDIFIQNAGIGLENMQERIEQLHGRFSISTEQGFRIFISVPKNSV